MFRRLFGRPVAALSITAALFALGSTVALSQPVVADGETLRLQEYPGSIVSLPGWVVMDGGFCKAHGLKCEQTTIPTGPVGLQALAAGSIEVSFASSDVIMQSASRGNDVQLIVGHSPNNIYELTASSDLHISGPYPDVMKAFVGKRIGVTARGAATEIQMRALLNGAGISPDNVTFVAVGSPNTAYPAMVAKQIDGAVMFQPFRILCETQKTCDIVVDFSKGEGPPELRALNGGFETFAARREFLRAKPKVALAFIQAMSDAMTWMQAPENFEKVFAIAKNHMSLGDIPNGEDVLKQLVSKTIPNYGPNINRTSVKAFSDFLLANKLIEKPVDAESFVYERAP